MNATNEAPRLTVFEAEAAAVLLRAAGHARALSAALEEAASVLARAGLEDQARFLDKLRELQRVVGIRVELLAKRVAEGS